VLNINDLSIHYGSRLALDRVSLSVGSGEVLALIGPNGAGKTTLIRTISGLLQPSTGEVTAGDQNLTRMSPARRAACLAVVPQARSLPEAFSVWETVLLGRTPYLGWLGRPASSDAARVRWALEKTDLLDLRVRLIGQLSGGEQQRVLLARALAQETPILLLDEPTAHLDLRHQWRLLDLVQKLAHEQGLAVLMAMHDLNLTPLYADRVALLVAGRLQAQGQPEQVLTSAHLSQAYGTPVHVVEHPDYGTPLVLPDGKLIHAKAAVY
jgi:iron complex transport system ATP-binding protein